MIIAYTDAKLVELLASRDPYALEYLYQYGRLLEVILLRRFGAHIVDEDRKDIVADTLIHAWEIGYRFDPQLSSIKSWLILLVLYQARDFFRRNCKANTISLDDIDFDIGEPEPATMPTDQHPSEHMQHLLHTLPPRRARICEMFYYEGQPVTEIASELRISKEAVRSHLSHARSDLRRGLEQG